MAKIHQLGTALQKFKELKQFDKLYYVAPMNPNVISELTIKEVTPAAKAGWVTIIYYKSDEAYELIPNKEDAPIGKIVVEGNGTWMVTLSQPMNVYFTNKKALQNYMHQIK